GSGAGSLAGAAPLFAVGRRQRHSAERTSRLSSSSNSSGGTPRRHSPCAGAATLAPSALLPFARTMVGREW
ncbi:unnamed protein product, partial [Gulo gulo]